VTHTHTYIHTHTQTLFHSPPTELKLKDVAKAMGKLFASGASVSDTASGGKEIVIQGDVIEGVAAMLEDKYQVIGGGEGGEGGRERVVGIFSFEFSRRKERAL